MPTGTLAVSQGEQAGISGTDAAAVVTAGALSFGVDGTIYRYCLATVAWAGADDALRQASATNGYDLAPTSTTAAGEQVLGAAIAANTIAQYGWATVYGKVAAMLAATGGYTAQLAVVGGVTATGVRDYAAATHTAAGPCGTACEAIAAASSGAILLKAM